jgi:hypothetical protein
VARRRKKKKKGLWLQTVAMASNRLMNSFRALIRKKRHAKKEKWRKSQRENKRNMRRRRERKRKRRRKSRRKRRTSRCQSQMTKKTTCPHALKTIPRPFPCRSLARLQVLRRPKGP